MTIKNNAETLIKQLNASISTDDLQLIVKGINGYNGSLYHLDFIEMESFEDYFSGMPLIELMESLERGFSVRDDYFHDNGNGWESLSKWSVHDILIESLDEILEELIGNLVIYINEVQLCDSITDLLTDILMALDNELEEI